MEDTRWFFGDIDKYYNIRQNGSATNSTPEMLEIIHPADRKAVVESLNKIASGEKDTHNLDYRWINRKGEKVWINCHGNVVRDAKGNPHIMIGRVSEENLRHLYNPLTSLWNKNKLRQDLKNKLEESKGYLVFLDIDGLAAINLSHGRAHGDNLLKEIAEFCENLDGVETAYHIDHNNFALVVDANTQDDVRGIYEKIKAQMDGKCTFTASAVPIDKTLFYDETQLLDSINMTLKKAKGISNNRIEFFSAEAIEKNYIDSTALEYQDRQAFINKIYELKEKMGIIHFNSKDILRENEVGLWVLRVNDQRNHWELHADETMEYLLGLEKKLTPTECFEYWQSRISNDYTDYVKEVIEKTIVSDKSVQCEFVWQHSKGDVMVCCSGKRVNDADGMVVLEGFYRNITEFSGTC